MMYYGVIYYNKLSKGTYICSYKYLPHLDYYQVHESYMIVASEILQENQNLPRCLPTAAIKQQNLCQYTLQNI
jgi:hypothetical protein